MQWVPSLRGKALWDRRVSKLIGPCSDVKRLPSSTEKIRCGIVSLLFPSATRQRMRRQGKKRRTVMVPVNGTRVGRGEERKRSKVHLGLSATGTATFDKSAMSRPKMKDD
jgi:hypothetical protein